MRLLVRSAAAGAAVFVSMAVAGIATPALSSAECGSNMSNDPVTGACTMPPPPPDWYRAPPPYAPSFAPPDAPPPPPWPQWAPHAPMWSNGFHQWGVYVGGVWVPL
ncbi:hypothetical protein [Mycobacterium palustre]|uniref:hypothetical protein n=1 Tax=Mycobacterium palustre TaxID=153971 RepID=UPI000A15F023|nr:hypothetical protein [Mycobacterium palustre]MCV7103690.1 hypothetical protein [Mycobacterium palustre]